MSVVVIDTHRNTILHCPLIPEMESRTEDGRPALTQFMEDGGTPKIFLLVGKVLSSSTPPTRVVKTIPLSLVFNSGDNDGEFYDVLLTPLFSCVDEETGEHVTVHSPVDRLWFHFCYKMLLDEVMDHSKIKKGLIFHTYMYEDESDENGEFVWHVNYDFESLHRSGELVPSRIAKVIWDEAANGPINFDKGDATMCIHNHRLYCPSLDDSLYLPLDDTGELAKVEKEMSMIRDIPGSRKLVVVKSVEGWVGVPPSVLPVPPPVPPPVATSGMKKRSNKKSKRSKKVKK